MKIPMTKKGYEALQAELTRLKREERPKNIQAITEAREHGDLKENEVLVKVNNKGQVTEFNGQKVPISE